MDIHFGRVQPNGKLKTIDDTFNIPVHYTTLSENEYEEMYALRQEKQCVLFEYYHK